MGLIAECVDDGRLMARALELAEGLASGPRDAFIAVRELMASACTSSLADQLEREAAAQGRLADSPDFLEGVMAFREKRSAKFGQR
jgi:2-(1,2-epoxy-1,2-dihydrophenyl)acetyl-CoA isomerase